jgi:hypothetical protein
MSYLNITDPAALHAAVTASGHAPKSDELRAWEGQMDASHWASAKAHRYAPDNQHLTKDAWVNKTVDFLNDRDEVVSGTDQLLEADKPYIVLVGEQHIIDEVIPGVGRRPTRQRILRRAFPTKRYGGSLFGEHRGKCDRCWIPEAVRRGEVSFKDLKPVHVARFGFIAEFHLCAECLDQLAEVTGAPVVIAASRRGRRQ